MSSLGNFVGKVSRMFSRHRRLSFGLLAVFLAVSIVMSGWQLNIVPIGSQIGQQGTSLTIGQNQVVLTIGTAEAATVTDYTCDGIADDVQFQAALNLLPTTGGKLEVLGGNYNFTATVSRPIDKVTIEGVGKGTYFAFNGVSAIFSAGNQTNWVFRDFSTDAGGLSVSSATNWTEQNITIGSTLYSFRTSATTANVTSTSSMPTGRAATLVVAASDALAHVKAQADYVCDGTADNAEIQTAINAANAAGGGTVALSNGTFNIAVAVVMKASTSLFGQGWRATTLRIANNVNVNAIEIPVAATYAMVSDLGIDGNAGNNAGAGIGIYSLNAVHPSLENLFIINCQDNALYIQGVDGLYMNNVKTFYSGHELIYLYQCRDSVINNINNNGAGYILVGGAETFHANVTTVNVQDCTWLSFTNLWVGWSSLGICLQFYDSSYCRVYGLVASPILPTVDNRPTVILSGGTGSSNISLIGGLIEGIAGVPTGGEVGRECIRVEVAGSINNIFQGITLLKSNYGVRFINTVTGANSVIDNVFSSTVVSMQPIWDAGGAATVRGNISYIAPAEERVASGILTAGVANAIFFAWHDPELQDILIRKVVIEITTPGGTALSVGQVGIANDAAGTGLGTEFFPAAGIDLNAAAIRDSWNAADTGVQTKFVFCDDNASATKGWVVGKILVQNAAALAGKYYIYYTGR